MKKPTPFYRISPALSGSGNSWHVEFVGVLNDGSGYRIANSIGYFKTLKQAKSVVAHFKRKPIEIPARS